MHSAGEANRGTGKVRNRCGDACETDMHSAGEANRGTGKVRNRCSEAGRQTRIQQERQTERLEMSREDVGMQADRHAFSRRGKQRDRKNQAQMR
jgi:hypothetical protein